MGIARLAVSAYEPGRGGCQIVRLPATNEDTRVVTALGHRQQSRDVTSFGVVIGRFECHFNPSP